METGPRPPGRPALWAPVVLALGLGLAGAQRTLEEVPVQPGFDAQKVAGRWLTLRLASSRARLVSPDDPLRLALHSIATRGRDLELLLFWTGQQLCRGVRLTVHPTGLPGQYHGAWSVPAIEGGARVGVRFVSTDHHSLLLCARVEEGGPGGDAREVTSLWALLARRLPGDPQLLRRFLGYVRQFQLQEAPVFNLEAPCPPPAAQVRSSPQSSGTFSHSQGPVHPCAA